MKIQEQKKRGNSQYLFTVSVKSQLNQEKSTIRTFYFLPNQILMEEQAKLKNIKITKSIPLTQSTKYQVIWKDNIIKPENDIAIKIISLEQQILLILQKPQERTKIRSYLASKINHFGFHQYFKTTGKIGQGSFASVYTTKKIQTGTTYAVKAIPKGQPRQQQAIRLQIKVLRKIQHENIIPLRQVYETQNSIYLLFDQLEGPSLDSKILNDALYFNMSNIKKTMEQILRGLNYLGSMGIFHRDLKLQNIKYKDKQCNHVCIIDFGLADFSSQKKYLFLKCGTPGYVAPQILNIKQGDTIDPICDIFSAGVIMYIMITKKHLFDGKNDKQALYKNKFCQIDTSIAELKNQHPNTINFLKRLLDKNPKTRISSRDALTHQFFGHRKASTNTTPSDFSTDKQASDLYFPKNNAKSDQQKQPKQQKQHKNKIYSKYLYYNINIGSGNNTPRLSSKEKTPSKGFLQRLKSNPSLHILRRSIQSSGRY